MRALPGLGLIAVLSGAALCQPAANKPAFDIADAHVSPRADWVKNLSHSMQGGFLSADRYELRRATMLDLIRTAYGVDADKVYGGPSWLDYDRFEIVARTRPGTRPETLRLMLQSLLENRFQLVVKMDTREVAGYILTKAKKELKLRAAADTSNAPGCQNLRPILDSGPPQAAIQCRNVTMDAFAARLHSIVSSARSNLPVKDSTGLEGGWDVDFQYPMRSATSDGPADAGVIEALDKLGLKLDPGKVPQPVLVVESVKEQPSPNPPGVAESLLLRPHPSLMWRRSSGLAMTPSQWPPDLKPADALPQPACLWSASSSRRGAWLRSRKSWEYRNRLRKARRTISASPLRRRPGSRRTRKTMPRPDLLPDAAFAS